MLAERVADLGIWRGVLRTAHTRFCTGLRGPTGYKLPPVEDMDTLPRVSTTTIKKSRDYRLLRADPLQQMDQTANTLVALVT